MIFIFCHYFFIPKLASLYNSPALVIYLSLLPILSVSPAKQGFSIPGAFKACRILVMGTIMFLFNECVQVEKGFMVQELLLENIVMYMQI